MPREQLIERLALLKTMLLQPDVILRSPRVAKEQPNEFWPLVDTRNSDLEGLCEFLTGIGASNRVRHRCMLLYHTEP